MKTKNIIQGGFAVGLVVCSVATAGTLQDAVDRMAATQVMAFDASVTVEIVGTDPLCDSCAISAGQVLSGYMDYYASGNRWHTVSRMGSGYPIMNTQVAFDGTKFSYMDYQTGTLSVKATSADPANTGVQLPVAPLLALQFLVPMTDANSAREPQLVDFRQAAAQTDVSGLLWSSATVAGRTYDRAELPGGHHDGYDYVHVVYARPGWHDRPAIVDRVSETGELLTRTILSHYEPVNPLGNQNDVWPRNVVIQAFEPVSGDLMGEISMVVNWISVGDESSLPAHAFEPKAEPGQRVFINGTEVQPE
jgi:hypothetical protein